MLPSKTMLWMLRRQAYVFQSHSPLFSMGLRRIFVVLLVAIFLLCVPGVVLAMLTMFAILGVQIPEGNPKHSATTGEMAIYKAHLPYASKGNIEHTSLLCQSVFKHKKLPSCMFLLERFSSSSMVCNLLLKSLPGRWIEYRVAISMIDVNNAHRGCD